MFQVSKAKALNSLFDEEILNKERGLLPQSFRSYFKRGYSQLLASYTQRSLVSCYQATKM